MTESLTVPARLNSRHNDVDDLAGQAAALDAADPLADFRDQFVASDDPRIIAYLDGNSLGRPLGATRERISRFVEEIWGRHGSFRTDLFVVEGIAAELGMAPEMACRR